MGSRLLSLDALRGFDMFFIMGGAPLIVSVCAALGAPGCAFARQFRHVEWAGFAFYDLIFPLFLFIAGVSFPFSSAARSRSCPRPGGRLARTPRSSRPAGSSSTSSTGRRCS